MEVIGTIHFFAIVGTWAFYLQKKIEPWPQWTMIPSYVILVAGVTLAAWLVGTAYT